MTTQQKNTVERIAKQIEKANGSQFVSVHNIRKGHIALYIGKTIDNVHSIRTTIFCDIEINTKGNVVEGFFDVLRPKTKVEYPYL